MSQKIVNFFAFVAMLVGVLTYCMHDDEVKARTQLTNAEAIKITQEIVKKYGHPILNNLGVKDDGILEKIQISKGVPVDENDVGYYNTRTWTKWDNGRITYAEGTNSLYLYPYTYLIYRDDNGKPVFLSKDDYPSKDKFTKDMINTLAHELRHYYQDYNGDWIKHPYETNLPHDKRWLEIDAINYAKKYVASLNLK